MYTLEPAATRRPSPAAEWELDPWLLEIIARSKWCVPCYGLFLASIRAMNVSRVFKCTTTASEVITSSIKCWRVLSGSVMILCSKAPLLKASQAVDAACGRPGETLSHCSKDTNPVTFKLCCVGRDLSDDWVTFCFSLSPTPRKPCICWIQRSGQQSLWFRFAPCREQITVTTLTNVPIIQILLYGQALQRLICHTERRGEVEFLMH